MSKVLRDLEVDLNQSSDASLTDLLKRMVPGYSGHRILRQSVDARRSARVPYWVYSIEVFENGEKPEIPDLDPDRLSQPPPASSTSRPLIVGTGPAGLFAAVRLVERGIPCTILERGSPGEKRIGQINRFWRYGELDPNNNVCMGEGGAGLYSDGKLITRIKSPFIPYVMDRLVRFGAPEEIRYLSNPHVGSDRIRRVIPKLRAFLLANGCEIHFDTPMKELILKQESSGSRNARAVGVRTYDGREIFSDHIVLATGHSAEDIFDSLEEQGVAMEGKSFALGLRIEHPQVEINKIQFRDAWNHPKLGAANYRLADHDQSSGIGVYSFCMCPGGYVLSSGTEADGIVSNGMSNYNRNSPFANAAIVVSIDHEKRFGKDLRGGMKFRRKLEQSAFEATQAASPGTRALPVQKLTDFMKGRAGGAVPSSSPSGVVPTRLDLMLPPDLTERLRDSIEAFHRKMKGFISENAQLHGVESRTSCPIRITRANDDLQSISHAGLYPAGEGAGYAGGITSAACDGVRIADQIFSVLNSQTAALESESAKNV